ncbi:MAG TPA: methyltransferase domain-containing protein [Dehalococcoidales bacterium]|nr:methyltransferase domain-containing protein [Dehalococcoidales bacterium]
MIKEYFNERAAIWDEEVSEKDVTKLERMARRLDIKSGSTVLDVGTGTGVFLPYLLSAIGDNGQIVAMDFAEEMLKIARAKCINGNVCYLCADVGDIPHDDETFDSVVCYSSFPHFRDKPGALTEIFRVTRSGGRLFICHTSGRHHINEIHRQIPVVQNDIIPDAGEMRRLLSMAGFIDIKIEDNEDSYFSSARKPPRVIA